MIRQRQKFGLRMIWLAALILFVQPLAPIRAQTSAPDQALVRITCHFGGRQPLISAGFFYGDTKHVVTALHGAAGCRQPLIVWSEYLGDEWDARIVRASHEGDLALLELNASRRLPITPLRVTDRIPPGAGLKGYFVYGYPDAVERAEYKDVDFKGHIGSGMLTLEKGFSRGLGLQRLFASQSFPKPHTRILRVNAPLMPGYSGGPIVNNHGRLVAIADGGLLGGFKTLNWSIPAHYYLSNLHRSRDSLNPRTSRENKILISAVKRSNRKNVSMQGVASGLRHVRNLSLPMLEWVLQDSNYQGQNDGDLDNIKFIKTRLLKGDRNAFQRLGFNVYQDPLTGATLGAPSNLTLQWDYGSRALVASYGITRMFVRVVDYGRFDTAMTRAIYDFGGSLNGLARWKDSPPSSLRFRHYDPDFGYANNARFFNGWDAYTGKPVSLNMSVTVLGRYALGHAVYSPRPLHDESDDIMLVTLMMQLAAQELSDFAVY